MRRCKFTVFAMIILLGSNFFAANVYAVDLMDVYKDALANDPKFKRARAQWLAIREDIGISRSALLPQIIAEGSLTRTRSETNSTPPFGIPGPTTHNYSNNVGYSLKLEQSIFNFASLANVWGAKAAAKSAHASFLSEEENLLLRTAEAYFKVLLAKDVFNYAKAKKNALKRIYTQTKHKYDVGITPITDLENARTDYDLATAEEIKAKKDVDDNLEKLNEITNIRYCCLDPLKDNPPLLSPKPANIEKWAKTAGKQNFDLLAACFATIAKRENIKVQNASHLPILKALGSYDYGYNDRSKIRNKTASASLVVQFPILQGGRVVASARQASYQYQEAAARQEEIHRQIVSETRQNYLGILASISRIKASRQAIRSAKSSLRATRAGYSVGTRTMADLLDAQAKLFEAQTKYAQNEFDYIIQLLNLKKLTGTLNVDDIEQVNSWLKKPRLTKKSIVKNKTKKIAAKKSKPQQKIKTKKIIAKKSKLKQKTKIKKMANKKTNYNKTAKPKKTVAKKNKSRTKIKKIAAKKRRSQQKAKTKKVAAKKNRPQQKVKKVTAKRNKKNKSKITVFHTEKMEAVKNNKAYVAANAVKKQRS